MSFHLSAPNAAVVENAFALTLVAFDAYGNQATGYTGTVRFTSSDNLATLPAPVTFGAPDAGNRYIAGFVWRTSSSNASLTATDTNNATLNGSQTGILVQPGGATALQFTGASSGPAGHTDTVTVTARDSSDNVVLNYQGVITLSSSDPFAVLPTSYAFTAADHGVHSFTVQQFTAGEQVLTASDGAAGISAEQTVSISAIAAQTLRLTTPTSTAVAGVARTVTITAVDPYGNTDPNFVGSVTLTSSDPNAVLPAPYTFTPTNAGSHSLPVTLVTAGTRTVTATGPAAITGSLTPQTVTVATLAHLAVSNVANALAGFNNSVTVTAVDAYNNAVVDYAGTVHFSSTDPVAVLPADTPFRAADLGNKSLAVRLYTAGNQNIVAVDTAHAGVTGAQNGIVVGTQATLLRVTSPSAVVAGVGFNVTLAATDIYGNIDPNYAGTVTLSSSDPIAVIPASVVLTGADAGHKLLSGVTLGTVTSNANITATDGATSLTGTRSGMVVRAGAPARFVVTSPNTIAAGTPFVLAATVLDNSNNVVTGYTGAVTLTSSDANGIMPSSIVFAPADQGAPRLGGLIWHTASTHQSITLADANGLSGSQNNIVVTALGATSLQVSGGTSAAAGQAQAIVVTAVDAYGNPASNYTGTVTLTSSDAGATLPGAFTFGAGTAAHTFAATFVTAGSQSVTATDNNANLQATQAGIVISGNAASQLHFVNLTDTVSGVAQAITLKATDAYLNIDATATGTVTLNSTDVQASMGASPLPVGLTFAAGDRGQKQLALTLATAGTQNVTAAGTLSGRSLTGNQNGIVVTAASQATRLSVVGIANGVAGNGTNAVVTAYDRYNNIVTHYRGTVVFSSSDLTAALPANTTFVDADAGTKTLPITLYTPGTQSVTVADSRDGNVMGAQGNIIVSAVANRFSLQVPTTATAGQAFAVTVAAIDNSNNVDTAFTGVVHFSSTDPNAVLPADVTYVAGDNGQRVIPGFTLTTVGTQQTVMAQSPVATPTRVGVSSAINVVHAAAHGLTVSAPLSVTAGGGFNVTVSAIDSYGNVFPGYVGTVAFTTNDAQGTVPLPVTLGPGDQGVRVVPGFFLRTATASASVSVRDANAGFTDTQGAITVTGLTTVTGLSLAGATSGTAGHVQSITVTSRDIYNNVVPQYRGLVTLSSSDPNAVLPPPYTFVAQDSGTHTFPAVQLVTAGTQSIAVADTSFNANQTGIIIAPAAAVALQLVTASATVAALAQNVTIRAVDAYGNVDVYFSNTVTLGSSDPLAILPAPVSLGAPDAGSRTVAATLNSVGTQTFTASTTGNPTGTSNNVTVSAAGTARLRVFGLAAASTSQSVSVNVRALDAVGNSTPAYRGTVHVVSSDPIATLPANATFTAFDNGSKALPLTFFTPGNQSVTVTDTNSVGITGNLNNIVVNAPAAQLRVIVARATTAGNVLSVNVAIVDNANNIATGYTGTLALTTGDARATFPSTITYAVPDGGNKTISGTFYTATPNQTITVVDTGGVLSTQVQYVNVNPAIAAALAVLAPSTSGAGATFGVTVTALDAYGNTASGYGGAVAFTSTDANATLANPVTFGVSDAGSKNIGGFALLSANANATLRATDTVTASITGVSNRIWVTPLAAVALGLSGVTSGPAGHVNTATVQALDSYGNIATGYRGTVAWSSSDMAATLPAPSTFGAADAGVLLVSPVVLSSVGVQSVTVTDINNGGLIATQANIIIGGSVATHLVVGNANAASVAGSDQNITFLALDSYGNLDPNFNGTLTLTSSDPLAQLPGPVTYGASDAGQHTLTIRLFTAGSQTITATSNIAPAQLGMLVNPNVVTRLVVSGAIDAVAGATNAIAVRAVDNYNNTTPGYRGTVQFTSTDANAVLPVPYAFRVSDLGNQTLPMTLVTAGTQSVTATDVGDSNIRGTQSNIHVGVQQTQLSVSCNTNVTAGVGFNVTVRATDRYGNLNTGYTGTVHLTSTDPNAVLPGDVTFAPSDAGTMTLSSQAIFKTASSEQTLTATDTNQSFTGSQTGIVVHAGPAAVFFVASPNSAVAGTPFDLTITALDAYNNTATSYAGQVTFSSSDANATLPAPTTLTTADAGSRVLRNAVHLLQCRPASSLR